MSTAVFLLTLILTLLLPAHYLHADPLSSSPLNPAFPMSQRQKTSFYTSGLEHIHLWGPAFGQLGWSTEIFFLFSGSWGGARRNLHVLGGEQKLVCARIRVGESVQS